jgi:signal transduction histidine kinase
VAAAERRTRSDLVVARQAAETANRLKTEFLTNMSHELRTPINGVLGMTELMGTTDLSEEQMEYAGIIRDSAPGRVALIDGILDFSELETGQLRLKPSEMDVAGILDDIGAAVRARAVKKPVSIEIIRSQSLPQRCIGEDKRIRQVFMHLCDNAIKFTERGSIRISVQYQPTHPSQGDLLFTVEDTGMGIAEDDVHFVFQPFTQIDGSLTRRNGGTGIGLSITKALVELMGGRIGVKSIPDVGSTFWFTVPVDLVGAASEQSENHEVLETT